MSAYDYLNRKKLLDLPTHQRRLRHLRSVAARNLSLPPGCKHSDVSHLTCYFTLHSNIHAKEFYSSEHVKGSLNPIWRSFDLSRLETLDVTSSDVVVKVWLGQESSLALSVEWAVNLSGLTYLGEQIVVEGKKYPPNSVVFGMWDGYFGVRDDVDNSAAGEQTDGEAGVFLELTQLRPSYCMNMLSRVYSVLRAIKQTEALVSRVRNSIEDELVASKNKSEKLSEKEMLILKVSKLRMELECRSSQLNKLKISHEQVQARNHNKDSTLHNKKKTLARDRDRLGEKKKGYFEIREKFVKTNAQLIMRKKQLIAELAFIYPVLEISAQTTNTGSPYFNICGVKLPNSEDFQGQDETMVAVGLGYTAHMVAMIAQFLDVPLRYPIQHRSSKSKVHDHITDKLADKDRDFPLYSKGKDKFHFNYAVYLLNKNIAQVRYYCGMGTNDLRLTLPNLKALLEMRLGVKFDEPSDLRPRRLLSVTTSNPSTPTSSGNPSPLLASGMQLQETNSTDANGINIPNQQPNNSSTKKSTSPSSDHSRNYVAADSSNGRTPENAASLNTFEASIPDPRIEKFAIHTLNDHVDSSYSMDKSHVPPSRGELFDAQFIKSESATQTLPGFRGVEVCDSGEGSSSDDNMALKYSAKFKTWQRNPDWKGSGNLSDNEGKGSMCQSNVMKEKKTENSQGDKFTSSPKTFKTKAMAERTDRGPVNNTIPFSAGADVTDEQELFPPDRSQDIFFRAESFDTGISSFNTRKTFKDRSDSGKS